jgi:hypothetical protein
MNPRLRASRPRSSPARATKRSEPSRTDVPMQQVYHAGSDDAGNGPKGRGAIRVPACLRLRRFATLRTHRSPAPTKGYMPCRVTIAIGVLGSGAAASLASARVFLIGGVVLLGVQMLMDTACNGRQWRGWRSADGRQRAIVEMRPIPRSRAVASSGEPHHAHAQSLA